METCPRCHARTHPPQEKDAAAWCHNCGDIYQLVTDLETAQADIEEERNPLKRKRARQATRKLKQVGVHGDGCDVAPACLECPLAECKYIDPLPVEPAPETKNAERDEFVRANAVAGVPVNELALLFGLSKRTVHRILAHEPAA